MTAVRSKRKPFVLGLALGLALGIALCAVLYFAVLQSPPERGLLHQFQPGEMLRFDGVTLPVLSLLEDSAHLVACLDKEDPDCPQLLQQLEPAMGNDPAALPHMLLLWAGEPPAALTLQQSKFSVSRPVAQRGKAEHAFFVVDSQYRILHQTQDLQAALKYLAQPGG